MPPLKEKAEILGKDDIERMLTRIAHEIVERNQGAGDLALVGIQTRGVQIAHRLAGKIASFEAITVPVGTVDVTLYRDDLSTRPHSTFHSTELNFSVDDKTIVLVDDVLYTGRTIRAALDALIDFGRPRRVQLAVLVDRGHRELPIRADYIGKNIPSAKREEVLVRLSEIDGEDRVYIAEESLTGDGAEAGAGTGEE